MGLHGSYPPIVIWIHTNKEFDPTAQDERMNNDVAERIYELDQCIECECCVARCATSNLREDFLGATGLSRTGRFMIDARDERDSEKWFEVVAGNEGAFGCMGLMGCDDVCPKGLTLMEVFLPTCHVECLKWLQLRQSQTQEQAFW